MNARPENTNAAVQGSRARERRFAERNPHSLTAQKLRDEERGLGGEITTGVEAMEEVANDPEWEEES